ncbi:MAG TPA: outer membrane lipoprotein-sorting protein [Spirochaetota bacterium]|nr:outer membrane lipoprotein-sorting protein [Spirochaetota bacterium]HQO02641.1 outer membrane lipoprotein-sorting protein [Spirochaetota bacterium]HQP48138.1 outer membrane lipoprotein-sorting protein [Spirochaetota bacterium]
MRQIIKNGFISVFLVCLGVISDFSGNGRYAAAQEERKVELTAQEILARVDSVIDYPTGVVRGKMVHILPTGSTHKVDFVGYISPDDYLFSFSTAERGEQLKVLYNYRGEDIWVYNVLSTKLFHKMGIDKYDSIVFTNFNYVDFSNSDFQSNYTAKITGDAIVKGKESYVMRLQPIFRGGNYGQLTLYVSKGDYIPLRIDYHDVDKVIFKTLSIADTVKRHDRLVPVRYDMLDIKKGTLTIQTFHSFENNVNFDKKIFMHQQLGER